MQVCRADSYRVMPWKNGGGSTTEIVVAPAGASLDDFDWRISMARVERDGPFSAFPGIDRTLTLLDGPRVELRSESARHVLTAAAPTLRFAGEERIEASVPEGPITDFNVMTRRARCRHEFRAIRIDGDQALARRDQATFIFLAEGDALRCHRADTEDAVLERRDGLLLGPADPADWRLVSDAPVTVFLIGIGG